MDCCEYKWRGPTRRQNEIWQGRCIIRYYYRDDWCCWRSSHRLFDIILQPYNIHIRVPNDCHSSYIFSLFKGKGDALYCGNYRGLKLQEHWVEILEHILSTNIGELGCIKNMQFGFMAGRGTTDLIFMLKKLQAEYFKIKKNI